MRGYCSPEEYLKPTDGKNFAIVDAAMNDLIRPSLYSAWQEIVPVTPRGGRDPCMMWSARRVRRATLGKDRSPVCRRGICLLFACGSLWFQHEF